MVILNVSLSLPTKSDGDIALVSIRMFIHLKDGFRLSGHYLKNPENLVQFTSNLAFFLFTFRQEVQFHTFSTFSTYMQTISYIHISINIYDSHPVTHFFIIQ